MEHVSPQNRRTVQKWLLSICAFVLFILVVGGLTRLTRSGLSMVDWRPIMGVVPPIGETQWQETFDAYKQFPEYQKINYNMNLEEFKGIFFWEYFHRILGRLVGLLFIIPWLYFLFTRKIRGSFVWKSFFGFILGGGQGLMGWYMVKSGLVNDPHVSHYRLTAHLALAIIIICYFYWLYLGLKEIDRARLRSMSVPKPIRWMASGLLVSVFVQILYGGLVAGLKAGKVFNTFPKMHGSWFPAGAFTESPIWINYFSNPGLVQFMHRSLAWFIVALCIVLFVAITKQMGGGRLQRNMTLVLGICFIQFCLGVATLLMFVPLGLASIHQVTAIILLLSVLSLNYKISRAEF